MTADVDIVNRALLAIGTRTTVSSINEISNEAFNANIVYASTRDELLRMAPWDCAFNFDNLSLLKAAPGTPENQTSGTNVWSKSIPPPPWAYEYAYPTDCLRACYIVPQFSTGFSGGVPITTAVTGGVPTFWNGPPVRFKIGIDQDSQGNDMRVLWTNQEQAILAYVKQVLNPDVWDPLFTRAFVEVLAARLVIGLTGDKALANSKLGEANNTIIIARAGDGNEGLTINDVTPDWIRVRGINYSDSLSYSPTMQFDWGPMFTPY